MPKKTKSNAAQITSKLAEDKYYESWWLLVERVSNGFVITMNPEGKGTSPNIEVISDREITEIEDPSDERELEARLGEKLAWAVAYHFSLTGSKHDKYRLSIDVNKQNFD